MAYNFCNNCGQPIIPYAYNCQNCGEVITQPQSYVNQQPVYIVKQKTPGKGFGITSMIMGIVASLYALYSVVYTLILTLISIMPVGMPIMARNIFSMMAFIVFIWTTIFVVLALVFGVCAKKRGFNHGMTKSGLIMGIVSFCVSFIVLIVTLIVQA